MASHHRFNRQTRIRTFLGDAQSSKTISEYRLSPEPIQNSQKNIGKHYRKLNVDEDQQQYVRYASKISNNNLDFLSTLEAENGLWTHDRVGVTGDIGFCQTSPYWHPEITNDPKFKSDPYWQLDRCLELYKGGTRFYGYDRREPLKSRFELVESL